MKMNSITNIADVPLKKNSPLFWLTLLVPALIIPLGINFLLNPIGATAGFGIPITDPSAFPYMWTKGVRDIFSGVVVLLLFFLGDRRTIATVYSAAILIPIGDGLIILRQGGFAWPIYIHWGTAFYMMIVAAFLFKTQKD